MRVVQTVRRLGSLGVGGYFDATYAEWAENAQVTRDVYRGLAAKVASELRAGKVLDIGSGPGHVSIELAKLLPSVEIVGLELSDKMIEIAEKNVDEHGFSARIEFRQGDAAEIPFEDASFDLVISSWSLHLWKRPAHVFADIYRVLKSGCRALIFDARKDAPKEEVKKWMRGTDSLIMRMGLRHSFGAGYTPQEIEDIVRDTPFRNCKVQIEEANMSVWLAK
jgi:ubiquinone/menaquinone biosynthesis C-methylase UbiE